MISTLSLAEARDWFDRLPEARRLATLAPEYVAADAARETGVVQLTAGYREGNSIWLHGVHRREVPQTNHFDFESAYGYGGPVSNCDDVEFLRRAWIAYTGWCREQHVIAEFVRLHPMAVDWHAYGGDRRENRATVAMRLDVSDLRATYEVRSRTAIRKAEKAGLSVRQHPVTDIVDRFAAFYRRGMAEIGAGPFYLFPDRYFAALADLPGIACFACERDGEWFSAGLFLHGGTTAEYHLSATSPEGRRASATNLLLDAAAAHYREQEAHWLYLGGGTDEKPENPLLFFKAGFSRDRRPFFTGSAVHMPEIYQALRETYRRAGGQSERTLFYRAAS